MKHVEKIGTANAIPRVVKPSWKSGIVFVCRECDGSSKRLRREIEGAIADAGLRKRVRVVGCDCLDVCPKHATTVVTTGPGGATCSIVPDARDRRTLTPLLERFDFDRIGHKEAS